MIRIFILFISLFLINCPTARQACLNDTGSANFDLLLAWAVAQPSPDGKPRSQLLQVLGAQSFIEGSEKYQKRKECNNKTDNFPIDPFN